MNRQAQLLELRGKVTSYVAENDGHNMLQLRKCFSYHMLVGHV